MTFCLFFLYILYASIALSNLPVFCAFLKYSSLDFFYIDEIYNVPRYPLAQACRSCPIQNSEFKIHNSPRPRWCELAARTPIRQFHPKVIKKTFFFALLF